MIDIKHPIKLMPSYYKDNDTYKDGSDKGILERFLEVIGDYFQDNLKQDINELLDKVIGIDTLDVKLINLVWEYLGSVPYGHGPIIERDLSDNFTIQEPTERPYARYRDLLKYTVSLYKIRGTLDFYPALLRLYGLDAIVRDPTGDYEDSQPQVANGFFIPQYDTPIMMDSILRYDKSDIGLSCIVVSITVIVPEGEGLLANQNFKDRVYHILNHFRPVHVVFFGPDNVYFTEDLDGNAGFTYIFPFKLT